MASNTKQQHVLCSPEQHTLLQHHVLADTFSTFSPLNEKDNVTDEKKQEKHEQTQIKKQDQEMTFATSETSASEA